MTGHATVMTIARHPRIARFQTWSDPSPSPNDAWRPQDGYESNQSDGARRRACDEFRAGVESQEL